MSRGDIIDPDVLQAIEDLRGDFAVFRRCTQQLKHLNPSSDASDYNAVRHQRGDKMSIFRTRAERIPMEADALVVLLAAHHDQKQRLKKRPSRHQMATAVRVAAAQSKDRLEAARVAFAATQAELASAEREDAATRAACRVYTGFSPL